MLHTMKAVRPRKGLTQNLDCLLSICCSIKKEDIRVSALGVKFIHLLLNYFSNVGGIFLFTLSMVTLDVICFAQVCMKKGSKCNHQSSQDWNDLEAAYASRIEPDGKGMFHDHFISILYAPESIPTHEIPGFT